jgi:hypothetical protein
MTKNSEKIDGKNLKSIFHLKNLEKSLSAWLLTLLCSAKSPKADDLGHGDDQMHNTGLKESPTKVGKSLYQINFQMIINSAKGQKDPNTLMESLLPVKHKML